jgi:hypothetical protein
MIIIGADYHPGFQQIAFVDTETGELQERRLEHREEAEKFYRELASQVASLRVGMEASGHARWFERLLAELGIELWIGDAAEIRSKRVRKQKTDRQDAELILRKGKPKAQSRVSVTASNAWPASVVKMEREVENQVAASTEPRTPNLHRAKQNRSLRVRMEGWRQW